MNLSINLLIVVITVVVSLLAFRDSRLIRQLSMVPPAVESGQYYRLVTYGFVHADGMHLAFNMFVPKENKSIIKMPAKPEGAKWNDPPKYIDQMNYRGDGQAPRL